MRIAIKFAYDGKQYSGYARQPQLKTVEGEVIKTFIKHGFFEDTKESLFRSAGRTDKDVSALCNVVSFNTAVYKKQIMEELSDEFQDIIVYGIAEVESGFNPRYAKHRQYQYYLPIENLDVEKIITAAACFTGVHNFSNFARVEKFKDPVRTIDNIVITQKSDFLVFDFFAQTFIWQQIRRIISALERIGVGKLEKEQIVEALCNPDKKVDYGLAPAEPLLLMDIVYDFEYNKILLEKLDVFEKRIISAG